MSSYISIWTKDDDAEVGPSVDEERLFSITVEPVGEPLPGKEGDTGIHLVTDGGHGLWTIQLRLSPAAKAKLLADLGADPSKGELGMSFNVAGSVAQALGQAAVDREDVTREEVVAYMEDETGPDPFNEDDLWSVLGPFVDQIEEAVIERRPKACPHCGETETVEISDPRPDVDQSVTVCANCGADD